MPFGLQLGSINQRRKALLGSIEKVRATPLQRQVTIGKQRTMFRRVSDTAFVSPQIELKDLAAAKEAGIAVIVNNRPEGEDPSAPNGQDVEAAAKALGLDYMAIPIGHSGFSDAQIDQMISAFTDTSGPVLAYCRSGTRSIFLWALAQAKLGKEPDTIAQMATAAGYDVAPIRPMLDLLAAN